MVNYLLEFGLIHAIIILVYVIKFSKIKMYVYRRLYLVSGTIFAMIIPLIKLPALFSKAPQVEALAPTVLLPTPNAVENAVVYSEGSTNSFCIWVYLAIAMIFILKSAVGIIQIIRFKKKSTIVIKNGIPLHTNDIIKGCFSFFNWIFIQKSTIQDDKDLEFILSHENAHIKFRHTLDLIFFEIIRALFWWSPTIWYTRQEISRIHEYQADDHVLQSYEYDQYATVLMNTVLLSNGIKVSSPFNNKSVYKRLQAMKQTKSIPSSRLYGLNLVLFALLFTTFACTEEKPLIDNSSKVPVSVEEIFKVVEQHPTYSGGMEAFYNHLKREVEYPRAAREEKVEGRVFVQYVIEKNGSITNVQTTRGIGSGCDEAAAKVIRNAPAFLPGKQRGRAVRTQMIIPITFQLDENQKGVITIGEATYNAGFLKVEASYNNGEWSGIVRDPNGDLLPGANILISGKTKGTVSDLNGSFKISASDSEVLSVSFVGYDSVSLDANVNNSN